jgi:hypothetical protein
MATPTLNDLLEDEEQVALEATVAELGEQFPEETNIPDSVYDRSEVYNLAKVSLDFLASLAMPTVFSYSFPPLYLSIWSYLLGKANSLRDFSKFLLGLPRGHAKTTLMKLFILWCILFSQKRFILIIASTARLAENILSDIADMLDEDNIRSVFGNWRLGIETDRQELKKFSFMGRSIIIAALGAESSLRGLNLKNERPDVILMEDMQTRENALSREQSTNLETWMLSTLLKAKSPKGCLFIFIGNMYPPEWCIIKRLKNNKYWTSIITGGILADGTALWEELSPLAQMLEEFETDLSLGHPEIFYSEVLNDDTAGLNTRFDISKLPAFPYNEFDVPQGRFIIIDPSGEKDLSDDTSIICYDIYDTKPVAKELIAEILSPSDTIRKALEMALSLGCRVIAVENVAYQASLLHWFAVVCQQLGIEGIEFVPVSPKGRSKNARISEMLKSALKGDIYWAPEVRIRIESEIGQWNPMKRDNIDNIIDNLAYTEQVIAEYSDMCFLPDTILLEDLSGCNIVEDNSCF